MGESDVNYLSNFKRKIIHLTVEFDLEKKKLVLITILFVFMGITAVATQVLLPDLLKISGLEIVNLPEPSLSAIFLDYWGDTILFALIIVLLAMTTFSSEIDINKQAYISLSRPISRSTYFVTKFLIKTVGIFLTFLFASLLTYFYSLAFFEPLDLMKFLLAAILVSISLSTIVAVVIMLSALFSTTTTGILGFIFLFSQFFVILIDPLKWIVPFGASNIWVEIFLGNPSEIFNIFLSITSLILWIIGPLLIGLYFYNKRDL